MKTITLKDDYQVVQLLQSIASNVIEWEKFSTDMETARSIQKELLAMAISIEKQTKLNTYNNLSISTLFANILAS